MNNQSTKQKLINLVSALEKEDVIKYFYAFISLKLYGTSDCPAQYVQEVCKMHEQASMHHEERSKQPEPTEEKKECLKCIRDISRKLYDIEANGKGIWLLNEIDKFIDNITK